MDIAGSVALVTGANRGLGAAFCRALLDQGASKVYAGARIVDGLSGGNISTARAYVADVTEPNALVQVGEVLPATVVIS